MSTATIIAAGLLSLPCVALEAAPIAAQVPTLPAFNAIEFHGGGQLKIRVGEPQAVAAVGESATLARLSFKVVRGTLVVDQKGYVWHDGDKSLDVQVSLPSLVDLKVRGAANTEVTGFRGGSTEVLLTRDGTLKASGEVEHLAVEVDGASVADFSQLQARSAQVYVPDWGQARFHANTVLYAPSIGVGSVGNLGQPLKLQSAVNGNASRRR
jgi:hypothetical protein